MPLNTIQRALTLLVLLASTAAVRGDGQEAGFHATRLGGKAMTDPQLQDYEMVFITLDLAPGGYDSRPHRHEADVYGVVLEGAVVIELNGAPIGTFARGEVFAEPYNAIHSAIRNASTTEPAKVMAVIPMRKGRELYVPTKQ